MDPDDPVVNLELKVSSWKNIFRVLKWCAPMSCSTHDYAYRKETGEHWSLGDFWAAIQHLQGQIAQQDAIADLANRGFDPLQEKDLLGIVKPCPLCGKPFVVGDVTAPLELEPADDDEQTKKSKGEPFLAACDLVHAGCLEGSGRQ